MRLILSYLLEMLCAMLIGLPVILLVRWCCWRRMGRSGVYTTAGREAVVILFFIYLVGLLSLTILPRIEWTGSALQIVEQGEGGLNLIPFRVFRDTWIEVFYHHNPNYFWINFVGNIVMFLPVGLMPALLWRGDSMAKSTLLGLGLSLMIELCQLPLARGTDVDDLWLNTLGAFLGYLIFLALARRFPGILRRMRVEQGSRPKG